jgi:hypothetical protein
VNAGEVIGEVVVYVAAGVRTHPLESASTVLMATALAVVGRRRKLGWSIGLIAQSLLLTEGILARNVAYFPAAASVAIYLWHFWQRRGESWKPIPTARQIAAGRARCTGCCVHHSADGRQRFFMVLSWNTCTQLLVSGTRS